MQKYLLLSSLLNIVVLCGCADNSRSEQTHIKVAYDKVIVSGQIGLILEKTDILKKHNLSNCEIKSVSDSPDIKSYGDYDIIITGEAGPLTLYSQGMDIAIVACCFFIASSFFGNFLLISSISPLNRIHPSKPLMS